MNIIVADDEETIRAALCDYLGREGYGCTTVPGGKEALAALAERKAEVVITDYNMNGMNGIELLGKLREQYPEIKVIILTAFADTENAIAAVNQGAYAYFRKPLKLEELRVVLEKIAAEMSGELKERLRGEALAKEANRLRTSLSSLQHLVETYKREPEAK